MSIRSRGFVAAMEDATPEVEINIGAGVPAEVEAQSAEVAEDAAEIHDETQAMEDAVADAETLDMIADTAEQSVEEGEGMDPVAAEIAEVAVESIYARLGITRKAMPSMESFGSAGSRKSATRIAVEEWGETVKKVWAAVVNFFKGLWEKIKALFEKFMNFFRGLEKAADAMKKRVEGLIGEPKEKEFENAGLAKGLGAGTGKATAKTAFEVLENSRYIAISLTDLGMVCDGVVQKISAITKTESKSEEILETLKKEKEKINEAYKQMATEGLYNNNKLVVTIEDGEASFKIEEGKVSEGTKVETLSKQEMIEICNKVSKLAKEVVNSKKITDAANKMFKSVAAVADIASKSTNNDNDKDKEAVKEAYQKAAKSTVKIGSNLSKVSAAYSSLATKAGKASLNYVAASMKQYGEKKEEKKN